MQKSMPEAPRGLPNGMCQDKHTPGRRCGSGGLRFKAKEENRAESQEGNIEKDFAINVCAENAHGITKCSSCRQRTCKL